MNAPLHDDDAPPPPAATSHVEPARVDSFQASLIEALTDIAYHAERIADALDAQAVKAASRIDLLTASVELQRESNARSESLDKRAEELRLTWDESVVRCESCNKLTARATAQHDTEDGVFLCPECA